jgi:hypothetical protein
MQAHFQFDRIGGKLIDDMGVESLMRGTDYPHADGVWPESSKYIEEQLLICRQTSQDHVRECREVLPLDGDGTILKRPRDAVAGGPSAFHRDTHHLSGTTNGAFNQIVSE